MIQCANWELTKKRFEAWWANSCIERPLLYVMAKRDTPLPGVETLSGPKTNEDIYLDVDLLLGQMRNTLKTHRFLAEGYPNLNINIGPGSLAVYQGSEPIFKEDTVWYRECLKSAADFHPRFDENEAWFARHLALHQKAQAMAKGEFLVNIPDIIENIDIYAAMRGPQNTCFDLIDEPENVARAIEGIDEIYFDYYDRFRREVVTPDGITSYTAFNVMGEGRVAKIQCDFCALMSPKQFRQFIQPSLRKQCQRLDHSVYHLDGPDAIKHLDALMEIEELQALQWTCGAGQPDSGSHRWYPIYDRVKEAGKALHLFMFEPGYEHWIRSCDELVNRYGVDGMYFLLPEATEDEAERFIAYADQHWKKG